MPNVARWSFKGFRQPDMLSGQEILLRQEKSSPIVRFSARVRSEADRKTGQAIERALKEDWGLREAKRYVDKAIAELEGRKKMGRPRAPFKLRKGWLQLNVKRLEELDASQKAELRQVIEQVLAKL